MSTMVERKLFKTKLCQLYQEGSCRRQSCSFAHGDKELRGFAGSFSGRRDYRGVDLRDKLDRRRSPLRRYSPRRDAKGRHAPRGYSPTSSPGERSDRKRPRKELDGQSDFSGSAKISDGPNDRLRDRKQASSDSKGVLQEQLRNLRSEVSILDNHKCKLEIYLEERVQEVDCLTSQIQELEMQLREEKEECKRVTSKIKKFVKAHHRYSRLQDDLKRSHEKLLKLGDQLGSDVTRSGVNEEDSSINILSDGDTAGKHHSSRPLNQLQENSTPNKRVARTNLEGAQTKSANLMKGEESMTGPIGLLNTSRWNVQHARPTNNFKKAEIEENGRKGKRSLVKEDVPRRGRATFHNDVPSTEKVKGSEPGSLLPPTSMAAHAADELETADEEALDTVKLPSKQVEKGTAFKNPTLPFQLPPPPPLPVSLAANLQGDDEKSDVDAAEESVHVDIV